MYHRYDGKISLQTGISLLFLVVAIVGSSLVLGVRGLRFWRTLKSFAGSLTAALAALTDRAAATEAHAIAVSRRTDRLTVAVADLQESLERLKVLSTAVDDARRTLTGWRGVVPKK